MCRLGGRRFLDLISSVCTTVKRATSALEAERCGGARCACHEPEEPNKHMASSHRDRTLAGRTSERAAKCRARCLALGARRERAARGWRPSLGARRGAAST